MIDRHARSLAAASVTLILLGGVSCSRPDLPVQANTAPVPESVPPVVPTAHVRRASISSRSVISAEFQPFQEVDVMAKVAGYVRSINVDMGDLVSAGQVLAELQIPEMSDEISKAAAQVQQSDAEITAARDELRRVESSHEIFHLSAERVQSVAKREPGLIPQQEVDEARSRDLVSEAQVTAAKSRLRVEEQKVRVIKAEETRLHTMRNYVTISAPFSGKVTKRYANLGAMVQAGTASQSQAMPIIRLSQISTLRLSLPVPESMVSAIVIGKPVDVQVKSLGKTFPGRVARSSGKVDQSTRTMTTEVDVLNPSGVILPGMSAEVTLETQQHKDVLAVSTEAVERVGSTARVYRIDASGVIQIVPIQIGLEDSERVEVASGLQEGDLVVSGRRSGLNAGDRVRSKVDKDR